MIGEQLALGVQLSDAATFETFFAGPNEDVVGALGHADTATSGILLFGPAASGKSHLLQAAARQARAAGRTTAYLPLPRLAAAGPEALEGLGDVQLVCLDDVDHVAAERRWALALVRLVDHWRAQRHAFVLSARAAPDRLAVAVPDLATRLSACAVLGLRPLDDADRLALLRARTEARGLELPDEVGRYLLTRLPRDTGSLLGALDVLDRASLSAQRRLTLPFVQQTLRGLV